MVLLEIHTDCQTSSEVARECPESHEDPQGKGRRKNKHSVCVYIYMALLYTLMDLHFPCSSTTVCICDMDGT